MIISENETVEWRGGGGGCWTAKSAWEFFFYFLLRPLQPLSVSAVFFQSVCRSHHFPLDFMHDKKLATQSSHITLSLYGM